MSVKKFAPVILSAVLLVTALAARAYSENGEVKPVSTSTMDTATNDNAKVEQMPVTADTAMDWDEPLVTHKQMEEFYPHLEKMLVDIEFLDPQNPRLLPLRLRRLFGRIQLDRMEYHLLRGIFSRVQALNNGTWKQSKSEK